MIKSKITFFLFFVFCFSILSGQSLVVDPDLKAVGNIPSGWKLGTTVQLSLEGSSGSRTIVFDYHNAPLDLSKNEYLGVDVKNNGNGRLMVDVQYQGLKSWNAFEGRFFVAPNKLNQTKLMLIREKLSAESPWSKTFKNIWALPGQYHYHWNGFDLKAVQKVKVTLSWENNSSANATATIDKPYGTESYTFPSISYDQLPKPIVDEMGQYVSEKWSGKLQTISDLKSLGDADQKRYKNAKFEDRLSQFGGFMEGEKQQAKGFFYTTKLNGKWWLVDPEGYMFWSQGVTCVGSGGETPIKDRAEFFPDFAAEKAGNNWEFLKTSVNPNEINFVKLNLKRKYGEKWEEINEAVNIGRMKSWGINTCGAWSKQPNTAKQVYTLIVHTLTSKIRKGKMPDPFSPEFSKDLTRQIELMKSCQNDPWLMGIFVDNELDWRNELTVTNEILNLDGSVSARQALETFLSKKYGTIEALNGAWGCNYTSFSAIDEKSAKVNQEVFKKDMIEYAGYFADTYYSICSETIHKLMPHHLYLGSRLSENAFSNKIVRQANVKYCDVITYNIYLFSVKNFLDNMTGDKPHLIGEFHFGTASNGVWGTGLQSAYDLENQAECYKQYMKEAASHPNFVGAHWFQWSDQPTTGRRDGENFRIGVVDITDQPYQPLVSAFKETSQNLYRFRTKSN